MNLYQTLGGEQNIRGVVELFYKKVLQDKELHPFFQNTDMGKHQEMVTSFLSIALGGPNEYKGRSLSEGHRGLNIQLVHFRACVNYLKEALEEASIEDSIVEIVMDNVVGLSSEILYK